MPLGEPPHVQLVDHRVAPRRARAGGPSPHGNTSWTTTDRGTYGARVAVVLHGVVAPGRVAEDRVVEDEVAVERAGVRVGEQLARVPARAVPGVERPVDAEAVALPGRGLRARSRARRRRSTSSSGTRCSRPASSNRHRSTASAPAAHSAKFVPSPSQVGAQRGRPAGPASHCSPVECRRCGPRAAAVTRATPAPPLGREQVGERRTVGEDDRLPALSPLHQGVDDQRVVHQLGELLRLGEEPAVPAADDLRRDWCSRSASGPGASSRSRSPQTNSTGTPSAVTAVTSSARCACRASAAVSADVTGRRHRFGTSRAAGWG